MTIYSDPHFAREVEARRCPELWHEYKVRAAYRKSVVDSAAKAGEAMRRFGIAAAEALKPLGRAR